MKILFYTMCMIKGGTERTIANLANNFIKDYDITIVTNIKSKIEYKLNKKIKVIQIDKTNKQKEKIPFKIITKTSKARTKKLKEIIKEEKPDTIVAFLPEPTIRILSLKKYFKNIKIIVAVRNHPNSEFKSIIGKTIRDKFYKKADQIIVQDKHYIKYFKKNIRSKIKVIPNYISEEFLRETKQKKKKIIMTAARLEKQKNIPLLIKAFSKLSKKYEDYKLIIYGDGKEKNKLEKIIKNKKLINKVFIKKPVDNIEEKMDEATLFILSSNYEGMPNTLLEAMAKGLPVIATNSSEVIKTIINDKNGIIVKKDNVKELTKKIQYLLDNEKQRKIISKEAAKIKEKYQKEKIIRKWKEIIDD